MNKEYRADIDGLRAIAVLSVITFHLAARYLPSGYLGVDIFFVISGYLITNILWIEAKTGRLSLIRFYERRLRRIGPALLGMLLLVTSASVILLLPVDLTSYSRSLIATLFFVSNIYFWRDTDYFSRIAAEKPLLHTWSLGVEEQFYILFPLLIWLCARYARQHAAIIVLATTAVSFGLAVYAIKIGAFLPAFYLLPTRAWELGAGAVLVFVSPSATGPRVREVAAVGAACLLLMALFSVNPDHSIITTMAAVVATMVLIATGAGRSTGTARILGNRAGVFIGKISFSLYLVHWPVIVFLGYFFVRDLTVAEHLAAFTTMILLAALSWQFVERPFREPSMPATRVGLYCALGTGTLVAAALALLATDGLPGRLPADAAKINRAVGTNYRCPISDYVQYGASRACVMNLPSRKPEGANLVLLGNSHAQMFAPLVADLAAERGLQGLLVPANGCLPVRRVNISRECVAIAETNIKAVLALPRLQTVVLGPYYPAIGALVDSRGRPALAEGLPGIVAALSDSVRLFQAAGKRVIVIGPIAEPGWDVASILSRSLAFGRPLTKRLDTSYPEFLAIHRAVFAAFEGRPDVTLVRVDQMQCRGARCTFLIDGTSLFSDDNHLSKEALVYFRPAFDRAFDRAGVPGRPAALLRRLPSPR